MRLPDNPDHKKVEMLVNLVLHPASVGFEHGITQNAGNHDNALHTTSISERDTLLEGQ